MIRIKLLYEELSTLAITEANNPNFALRLHKNLPLRITKEYVTKDGFK